VSFCECIAIFQDVFTKNNEPLTKRLPKPSALRAVCGCLICPNPRHEVDVLELYTSGVDLMLRELLGIVDYHGEKMVLG
jgi:hypothetical protein